VTHALCLRKCQTSLNSHANNLFMLTVTKRSWPFPSQGCSHASRTMAAATKQGRAVFALFISFRGAVIMLLTASDHGNTFFVFKSSTNLTRHVCIAIPGCSGTVKLTYMSHFHASVFKLFPHVSI